MGKSNITLSEGTGNIYRNCVLKHSKIEKSLKDLNYCVENRFYELAAVMLF